MMVITILNMVMPCSMRALSKDCSFEVIECYHDYSYIIHRSTEKRVFKDVLNSHPALSVDIIGNLEMLIVLNTVPYTGNDIFVRHFVKDSITT